MSNKKAQVKINFDNDKVAKHFMNWLSGQGEQDYWLWMECREQEEASDITATNFDNELKTLNVNTHCSRLDKK